MGKVYDSQQPKDERETKRQEYKNHAVRQTNDQVRYQGRKTHVKNAHLTPQPRVRSGPRGKAASASYVAQSPPVAGLPLYTVSRATL